MDPTLGDIAGGSVHVRNGEIVAVGKDIAGRRPADRRQRHDRDARPRRNPLAHVEHALSQLCRRQAGGGLFPDRRALRRADDAGRHVPEHAARGGRGDQFRHDLRSFLVPQRAQHRACRSRYPRARGSRHPRAPFLRLAAGHARYPDGRSGADREPRQGLEELVERGPDLARHGVARPVPRRPDHAGGLPAGVRQCPQARPADHRACRERAQGGQPDRAALQGEADRQGRAAHPRAVGERPPSST